MIKRLAWLLLFSSMVFSISVLPAASQAPEIVLPSYEGYISVAPAGRYFVDENGTGFLVIGQNDAVSWPGLSTLFYNSTSEATENYIKDLRAHGITVSRVMIEYAQEPSSYFERPIGTFVPEMVAFWDNFIQLAEKHGLYLLLTPYDTFWQAENWEQYPYHVNQGGPCEFERDWLTKRECIDTQKNRWRFILDRWGGSPNIFAWDIMNEIDIWWNASDNEIQAYVDEMAAFIREYELEKWGRTHMLSVSSAAAVPDGRLGRVIYQHPALDFANTHLYIGPAIKAPLDPIDAGPLMGGGVLLSLEAITDDRPYFDSESGPIDNWIESPVFDQEYHHNMSWAHLAAGGAGSGMRWPYSNPHWILPELRDNLLGLARVASTIDWANFPSENINNRLRVERDNIARIGCSDGQTALIWLLALTNKDENVQLPGASLTIRDVLEDGDYTVEFWETYDGNLLASEPATVAGGELTVTVPEVDVPLKDVAIIVRAD